MGIDIDGRQVGVFWSEDYHTDQASRDFMDILLPDLCIGGDVRISLVDASKKSSFNASDAVAGQEPGCLLYFLFHVACLNAVGKLELQIGSGKGHVGVDRAWKKPKEFHMSGRIA